MYFSLLVCSMVPALFLESSDRQLYLLSEKFNQDSLCNLSSLCPSFFPRYVFLWSWIKRNKYRYDNFAIRASNNFQCWFKILKSLKQESLEGKADNFENSYPRFDFRPNFIKNSKWLVAFSRLFKILLFSGFFLDNWRCPL